LYLGWAAADDDVGVMRGVDPHAGCSVGDGTQQELRLELWVVQAIQDVDEGGRERRKQQDERHGPPPLATSGGQ
jgi:hypothetical protein